MSGLRRGGAAVLDRAVDALGAEARGAVAASTVEVAGGVDLAGGGLAGAGPGGAAMSAWLHLVLVAAWLAAAIALLAVLMAWLGRPDDDQDAR